MGLAAGINFSLRSVALAGDSYRKGHREHILGGDEILQMFGRAGRRGLDEIEATNADGTVTVEAGTNGTQQPADQPTA